MEGGTEYAYSDSLQSRVNRDLLSLTFTCVVKYTGHENTLIPEKTWEYPARGAGQFVGEAITFFA